MSKFLTTELIIQKIANKHGNEYDYSEVEYVNYKTEVIVKCKKHGRFLKTPKSILDNNTSSICRKCWQESLRVPKEVILKRLNEIHKGNLQFDMSNYVDRYSKIPVTCKEHGKSIASAESLLRGGGCYQCGLTLNKVGWEHTRWEAGGNKSRFFEGFKVYLIKCFNNDEIFYKIGKTYTNVSNRFNKKFPYNWELISEREGSAIHMSNLEKELHKECKEFKYSPQIPFKGQFECFKFIPEIQQIFNTLSK